MDKSGFRNQYIVHFDRSAGLHATRINSVVFVLEVDLESVHTHVLNCL